MMSPLVRVAIPLFALMGVGSAGGCASVGPGQTGVLWTATRGTLNRTYGEGLHSVAPWNDLKVYDLRVQNSDELLDVIAVNGLNIRLDASVRYRIDPKEVVALHQEIGKDYYKRVLEPVLRSEARRIIGQYTPEEIYSTKRDVVEREIRRGLRSKIEGKHIILEAVLIRNVELPPAIRTAIDQKLAAQQEVLKMKYVLEVARAKAEQKRIEARGIADYNHTIAASLSPGILEFNRIQELERLARSPNAKTVVLGGNGTAPAVLLSK
jgi:prohibitin 2